MRPVLRAARGLIVGAALGLAVAGPRPASAQAPPAGRDDLLISGATSVAGWWGAPGRPGFLPQTDLGAGYPWTIAGLVRGAWELDEGDGRRSAVPWPGAPGAQRPLLWADTIDVRAGEGGVWSGGEGALAHAASRSGAGAGLPMRPRGDLILTNGSAGINDNALSIAHADTLGMLRLEAASGTRDLAGSFAGAGRDLYDVSGTRSRGPHTLAASFDHRRADAGLIGGEHEEVRSESGTGRYSYQGAAWRAEASFARGYDRRSSGGGAWGDLVRLSDASTGRLELERAGPIAWGAGLLWRESRVAPAGADSARVRGREVRAALRHERPLGEGTAIATLEVLRDGATSRTEAAPSLAYRFADRPWRGRVVLERLLTPIGFDLAPGQSPFLQDTWVTGLELNGGSAVGGRVGVSFLAGRTHQRAVLSRLPLESLALRSGFRADPENYGFGLLHGEAEWRARHWAAGVEGYGLARNASPAQAAVDPGSGARAFVETSVALFQGDLRLRPRVEAAAVGSRESEAAPATRIPGFTTWTARLQLTLADAVLLVEGRNLEGRIRRETWIDSSTGVEALGPGRELRFTFSWRLWD